MSALPDSNSNDIAAISLHGVVRSYTTKGQPAFHALRGIDFTIPARQFVAVLGKSGSGKSTLLNLVAGLDRASAGTLCVGGTMLNNMNETALARWRADHVGVVFQFFQLLPTLTAQENIMLAMEYGQRIPKYSYAARARELLDRVGVADQAAKLPHTLSGGQQQRVAIARALANDPPVLLADEPTGNLDTETSAEVESLLVALAQEGKTIVAVTHDAALAARANRVVKLADGRIVDDQPKAASA